MSDFDVFGHSDSSVSGSEEMDIVNGAFYTNVQHQNKATEQPLYNRIAAYVATQPPLLAVFLVNSEDELEIVILLNKLLDAFVNKGNWKIASILSAELYARTTWRNFVNKDSHDNVQKYPVVWRDSCIVAHLVSAYCALECDKKNTTKAYQQLDLIFILYPPIVTITDPLEVTDEQSESHFDKEEIHVISEHFYDILKSKYELPKSSKKSKKIPFSQKRRNSPKIRNPMPQKCVYNVKKLGRKNLVSAFNKAVKTQTPLLIKGGASSWPAVQKWLDLEFWRTQYGHRMVPIETGTYCLGNWQEDCVTLNEFLDKYIADYIDAKSWDNTKPVGYLAQHSLLTHWKGLRSDIIPPDFNQNKTFKVINSW